ncbi:MAG: PAS domain-containing sensor histidine kinase, partial [Proteobacteria bacterium]
MRRLGPPHELNVISDRLRRVIEATGEGIWERRYTPESDIEFIDVQAKKVFGYGPDDDVHYFKTIQRIPSEDQKALAQAIREHDENHTQGFDIQFRMATLQNSEEFRWIHARGRVEREDGEIPLLISTVRDVTEQVEQQHLLKHALEAAKEATRAKAEFLANMSHEIRTPLNGVIGMTDLLLDTEMEKEQRNFANIIQQSGLALLHLINDILDFSKIEAGKMQFEQVSFSLTQLVEGQADVLIAKAREKDLSLMTYISPNLPIEVIGDSGRIGQILLNLISNAIKFTPRGGVTVRVQLSAQNQDSTKYSRIRFEVEDTGIGMDGTTQAKLFKPFVQADESTARKFGGTGLGLSICKRLTELMNGEIGVTSHDSQGSTFWFELPLEVSEALSVVPADNPSRSTENIRILVVDHDPVARDVLDRYLSAWGMKLEAHSSFSSVMAAITRASGQATPFDLVVIGQKIAKDQGIKLGQEIRARYQEHSPKLILVEEFGSSTTESSAQAAGFQQLITKPVKQSALYDSIVKALGFSPISGRRSARRESITATVSNLSSARILVAEDTPVNQLLAVK